MSLVLYKSYIRTHGCQRRLNRQNNIDLKLLKGPTRPLSTSLVSQPTTKIRMLLSSTVFMLCVLMAPPGSRFQRRPVVSCFPMIHNTLCVLFLISLYLVTLDSQEAEGFLESNFVTGVAKYGLSVAQASLKSYGYPTALYALILAGVCTFFFLP
jgi:hypothetical protein